MNVVRGINVLYSIIGNTYVIVRVLRPKLCPGAVNFRTFNTNSTCGDGTNSGAQVEASFGFRLLVGAKNKHTRGAFEEQCASRAHTTRTVLVLQ